MKKLLAAILLTFGLSAFGQTFTPFTSGQLLTASELNSAFSALYGTIATPLVSSTPPVGPTLGKLWLNTAGLPYTLNEYDGTQWVTIGSLNLTTHQWVLPGLGTGVATALTNPQGTGTKIQLSTGSTTTGDCVQFDSQGNTVDSGVSCSPTLNVNLMSRISSAVVPASATPISSGLSIPVVSGGTYSFEIFYYMSSCIITTNPCIITLNQGTATVTSIAGAFTGIVTGGSTLGAAITSITQTYGNTTGTDGVAYIAHGTIVVNAGGTFVPGFATANAATSSLLPGSWMRLIRIN